MYRLNSQAWITDTTLACDTSYRSEHRLAILDIEKTGHIEYIKSALQGESAVGSWMFFGAKGNTIVAAHSQPNLPQVLCIGQLNGCEINFTPLTPVNRISEISWAVHVHPAEPSSWESIVVRPTDPSLFKGVIAFPHGGPHGVFDASFVHSVALFVSLGYFVVMVNYRGSIGFGQASIESLPGKVGVQDVNDTNDAVSSAIKEYKLDDSKVVVFGGSHGGLLGAHLTGQFPQRYKAAVLRNPVVNIPTMLGVTEIPDWCWVESGLKFDDKAKAFQISESDFKAMRDASPMSHILNVKAPTLVMLGAKDLRVPNSQGQLWHDTLRGLGVKTRILLFPEDNHNLYSSETESDVLVNTCLWYQDALSN